MLIGDYFMVLEIDKSEEAVVSDELSDYVYEITGRVLGLDDRPCRQLVGKFRAFYFDVQAGINAYESVFELFDDRSETYDYYEAIFGRHADSDGYSEKLCQLLSIEPYWANVLVLDRLEILPKFRAHNLGLIVMRRLIERFGAGTEIVAIKPFPLQSEDVNASAWRRRLRLSEFEPNHQKAVTKLRRHYRMLGFKHMRGTPFMFRLTNTPLPSVDDLGK